MDPVLVRGPGVERIEGGRVLQASRTMMTLAYPGTPFWKSHSPYQQLEFHVSLSSRVALRREHEHGCMRNNKKKGGESLTV